LISQKQKLEGAKTASDNFQQPILTMPATATNLVDLYKNPRDAHAMKNDLGFYGEPNDSPPPIRRQDN